MSFIDLHTHKRKSETAVQILNVFAQDLKEKQTDELFSSGIHPWHLEAVNQNDCLSELEKAASQKNMIAFGECGLDRAIQTDFAIQESIFRRHIELAERHSKPLIIHAVRSQNELIRMKKESRSSIPWILHGFRGNTDSTRQLSGQGFYFSLGENLLHNPKLQKALPEIPRERLFFETDDKDISIQKIYLFAAQILGTDLELLAKEIETNFINLFGDDKLA